MWITFLYTGQIQSIGKNQVQCTRHMQFLFQRSLKGHPVMIPCFKLKDKWCLQRRHECLTEIAARCKLEPTSGTGGTPGERVGAEEGRVLSCPCPFPCRTNPLSHRRLRSSCFYCILSARPVLELKHFACLFSSGKCWCLWCTVGNKPQPPPSSSSPLRQ